MRRRDPLGARPGERRSAREHLVQDTSQRVEVGSTVHDGRTGDLLRTQVFRRADEETPCREAGARGGAHGHGNTQARDQHVSVGEQDGRRRDVTVYDAVAVRIAQRLGHVPRNAHGLRHR